MVWVGWTGYLLTGAPSPGPPPAFPQSPLSSLLLPSPSWKHAQAFPAWSPLQADCGLQLSSYTLHSSWSTFPRVSLNSNALHSPFIKPVPLSANALCSSPSSDAKAPASTPRLWAFLGSPAFWQTSPHSAYPTPPPELPHISFLPLTPHKLSLPSCLSSSFPSFHLNQAFVSTEWVNCISDM